MLMGPDAAPEAVQALAVKLGLDLPPMQRYWQWVSGMLAGELGTSYAYSSPVLELVLERLALTVPLAVMAMALTTVLALVVGVYAASRHNQRPEIRPTPKSRTRAPHRHRQRHSDEIPQPKYLE